LIAAAALATLKEITETDLMRDVLNKEQVFRSYLKHKHIKEVRGRGLMLAIVVENSEIANQIIFESQRRGLILFWLLFEPKAVRITPPLTISEEEIIQGCEILISVLDSI
jgi:acetylornithine/N-succinyldiaminopimelate aminotransferase